MDDQSDSEMASENAAYVQTNRWRKRWIFASALLLLCILIGVAWWQRNNIAERLVADQLKKYNVKASYRIEDIGLRTQRLRDVVIGDPANPDFVAKSVEIDVAVNFTGTTVKHVRVNGVKMHGLYTDGKVTFGELDKFRDLDNKQPFELPDIALDIKNARIAIATPWGLIGVGGGGNGHLRNHFDGEVALRSPSFGNGDCSASVLRFDGRFALDAGQPSAVGPLLADRLTCTSNKIAALRPVIDVDVRLSKGFDSWFGDIGYRAQSLSLGGDTLAKPKGTFSFDGNARRTNYDLELAQASYQGPQLSVRELAATSKGYFAFEDSVSLIATGEATAKTAALAVSTLAGLDDVIGQTKQTPVGPILADLIPALRRAAGNFDAALRYDANIAVGAKSRIAVEGLEFATRSGARLYQDGTLTVKGGANGWTLGTPLQVALRGGDLPTADILLKPGKGRDWSGSLSLAPFAASGANLTISQLTFAGTPGASWTFNGGAVLSGPLPGGSVSGLILPIDGRWDGRNLLLYNSCQNVSFTKVTLANLSLAPTKLQLCPSADGAIFSTGQGGSRFATQIPNFEISGMLGSSPLQIGSNMLDFDLQNGFRAKTVRVALGNAGSKSDFEIAALNGRFNRAGLSGVLSGGSGKIANVPLLLASTEGQWSYASSTGFVALEAETTVSDSEQVDRFSPLKVPDMLVNLQRGVITALGHLYEPTANRLVADVDINHVLSTGAGRALFAVDDLKFSPEFQPSFLTPLTLGVAADVIGSVSGDGAITWSPNGVKSTGRFSTASTNLAAAFGPVERLQAEITFSDLLAFETAPGQIAQLGSVNPGIAALNGQIRYQLLPGKKFGIEGGTWPFAGGQLILEPTVLDFGIDKERRLTFRVEGIDAAKFLQQYELDNFQVSGIFDGTLPMVFNQDGGRIVGGRLVSRTGGGELSYLGQLSYKDVGVFANFAFDALKSIRYNELSIGVNGDLGGEIITEINFAGVQQGAGAKRNFITRQLAKLPIEFNVRISAKFLELIGVIRGVYDAEYANEKYVKPKLRELVTPDAAPTKSPKEKPETKNE